MRLVFPGGKRERQEYSVNKLLSVREFKRRLATTLLETYQPISLFVSPDWQLLDHAGCVTDQQLPGTNLNCPFLTHGSTVVRVEMGNRRVSLVGDTLDSKSPARRGENNSSFEKRSSDPEKRLKEMKGKRLKEMKGISAEPVKWYSSHRP